MNSLHNRIALHTWTLDSSPLKDALRIADSFEEDHFQNHPWHHAECLTKLGKRHIDLDVK